MKGNTALVEKLVNDHFVRNCDMFAESPLGILIIDGGGSIIKINSAFEEITGITGDDKDIQAGGKVRYFNRDKVLFSPEELPWSIALKQKRIVDNVEIAVSWDNAELKWSSMTVIPLDCSCNFAIVVIRDIMKSKILSDKLRESETKYRSLYENSFDAIFLTDPGGDTHSANPAACKMLGMTEEEIRSRPREEVVDTTDPAYLPAVEERKTKNRFCGELTMIRKGGEKFPVELSSSVFRSPEGREYTSMIVRDITARKLSLEKLHESEEKFRLLSESASEGVAFFSPEGRIIFLNRKAAERYNGKPEDFTGNDLKAMTGAREGSRYMKRIINASSTDRVFTYEDRIKTVKGIEWYTTTCTRVCNSRGQVIGVQVLSRNITRRKEAELRLRQATKDLREHSNRLRDMIENERLQLARDLHDIIGQRLAAMNFYYSWLRSKIGDKVEGTDPVLDEITRILNDTIKNVVEISHGLRPDILDELGLSSAVEWQAAAFERTFGIECKTFSYPPRVEPGKDLSLAVYRIIQEALTNISRHSKATRASVGINENGRSLRVLIRDNGVGIDPSKLDSLKSLGLIGMRERARSLGGEVHFTNLRGRGTRVLALFPLNEISN